MLLASAQPYVSTGGSAGLYFGGLIVALAIAGYLIGPLSSILSIVASWASVTLLVFLRKDIGVRALSIPNFIIGVLFLYFVGNMVGHNYHDLYRNVGWTIWGARIHFTYLVLFIGVAVYRKVEGWQRIGMIQPSSWGDSSAFAQLLPTHSIVARKAGRFYSAVIMDPLAAISFGLILALPFHNWFGWYLVLSGCLLFFSLLNEYVLRREEMLDGLENSFKQPLPDDAGQVGR